MNFLLFLAIILANEEIQVAIDKLIKASPLEKSKVGIAIYSLDKKELIFALNKDKPFIPASNQKLLTTFCGLQLWNKSFKNILARKLKRQQIYKRQLFNLINSKSNNAAATAMFLAIGEYKKSSARKVLRSYLNKQKIPTNGLLIADGSGRSTKNRATPFTYLSLLNYLYASPYRKTFLSSLAVSGKKGTLKKKLLSLRRRVYAKTGYLRQVYALSGYLFSPNGRYSFSIIINDKKRNFCNWEFIEKILSCLR